MLPASSNANLAANRLVQRLLLLLLDQAPWATSVCLKVIDANAEASTVDEPYFRVTSRLRLHPRQDASARWLPDALDWNTLLPALRAGRAPVSRVADPATGAKSDRLSPSALKALVCPAAAPQGHLLGAIVVVFDPNDGPTRAELKCLADHGTRVGSQIAAVLDLGSGAARRDAA